jgi:tetratricopeptide (TPR) repeat protein
MKTITFYSYKGGVGRSLALSNIAIRLSELNKKVCVIDFDLDAPGLRFKFPDYTIKGSIEKGLVDYVYLYSHKGIIPDNISDYTTLLFPNNLSSSPIQFISAGDFLMDDYWKKLSMISWSEMFYSEQGQGIRFFLDLKAKIEKEINPDVLLIDSRTGITDIAGITLRLFADEIVVLAVNNKENSFGSKKIIKNLLKVENDLLKKIPKIHFVLTRLPFLDNPQDKAKEFSIIQEKVKEFERELGLKNFEISVIHSDRRLEEKETPLIGISYSTAGASISNDYLKLFDLLTADILSKEETEKFKNWRLAELEYSNALVETDLAKKIIHLDKAIAFNNQQFKYFNLMGVTHWQLGEWEKAADDFLKALALNPNDDQAKYSLGAIYYNLNQFEKSIEYLDRMSSLVPAAAIIKAIIFSRRGDLNESIKILDYSMKKFPNNDQLLNTRADILRKLRDFEGALKDIYKAIEIDPVQPIYIATLAEINYDMGQLESFYINLTIALSKGLTPDMMSGAFDVYGQLISDKRFVELMEKYQIKPFDIKPR